MSGWISLTPSGQELINKVGNWFKTRSDALNSYDDPNLTLAEEVKAASQFVADKTINPAIDAGILPESARYRPTDPNLYRPTDPNLTGNVGQMQTYGSVMPSSGASTLKKQEKGIYDIIMDTTKANNEWAAAQAQKQMDFQERMARNSHTYEIEDLKNAGLNPVLSVSGGNGAAAPSGAMAQPDTSNTRLLAEMSMASLDALGNSAVQLASGSHSGAANNFRNMLMNLGTKVVLPTLARQVVGKAVGKLF